MTRQTRARKEAEWNNGSTSSANNDCDVAASDGYGDSASEDSESDDIGTNDSGDERGGSKGKPTAVATAQGMKRSILYEHVKMYLVRSESAAEGNKVVMVVKLVHTKGEENKPQP